MCGCWAGSRGHAVQCADWTCDCSGLGLTYVKRVLLGPDRGEASCVSRKMEVGKAQECLGSGL